VTRPAERNAPPARPQRVLIVDDDPLIAASLADFLRAEGHTPDIAPSAESAIEALQSAERTGSPFDIAILDVSLPGMNGMALLREVSRRATGVAAIMLTGYGTVESAVEALRQGACDFLVKPVVDAELRQGLERAARQRAILQENQALRKRLDQRVSLEGVIGSDARMRRVYEMITAVAASRTTVLIEGESGTGKSLIAHAVHHHSPRKDRPFVELSCGSIPETLLESELFGHAKGAFTGAHADKAGRFIAANGGTIFLDEINSASPAMQLKLLRVLQERRFEPVGGTQTIEVDVRVILASNQPLEALVAAGQFRQDLYYRINVMKIDLPPLRERVGDIPALAARFLARYSAELGRQIIGFAPEALDALVRYHYPGNVRELQNIVERAAVLSRGQTVTPDDLPAHVRAPEAPARRSVSLGLAHDPDDAWTPVPLEEALREPEKQIILRALKANAWNRQKTSEQLAINRTTLYKKMKSYGLLDDDRLAG